MKKLLILGASPYESKVVERAQNKGIYTIVTDQYLDRAVSPAKLVADEAWDISWSDIDTLEQKCREEGVNGIIAGFSEFRVENLIKLTDRLSLPCYCTLDLLEKTRDKVKFKEMCRKYDIPVVPEYEPDDILDDAAFPVIVKPVDRGGSIGITVAYNQEEYKKSKEYALSLSPSKHIIVEKFMCDYQKIDLYYIILDGRVIYFGSTDTVMDQRSSGIEIIQRSWQYPSIYESAYLKKIDKAVRNMMEKEGMKHGYITYSAFAKGEDIYFFETGYRFSGELSFHYCHDRLGFDYLDVMLDEALSNPINYDVNSIKPVFPSNVINFHMKNSGIIGYLEGCEKIERMPELVDTMYIHKAGETIEVKNNRYPYVAFFTVNAVNQKHLEQITDKIRSTFDVKDCNGKSMLLK